MPIGFCADFTQNYQAGFDGLQTYDACDPERTRMLFVRMRGEIYYLEGLDGIPNEVIEGCRD